MIAYQPGAVIWPCLVMSSAWCQSMYYWCHLLMMSSTCKVVLLVLSCGCHLCSHLMADGIGMTHRLILVSDLSEEAIYSTAERTDTPFSPQSILSHPPQASSALLGKGILPCTLQYPLIKLGLEDLRKWLEKRRLEEELGRRALFKSFNEETLARFYTLGSSNDDLKMT